MVCLTPIAVSLALVILFTWAWSFLNWVWFRPKKLEKCLREQGFKGNPYRLWHGDLKDKSLMTKQALSTAISFSDDIVPHVVPFHHHILQKYGKNCFVWNGPDVRVVLMDPDMIRDIFFKHNVFRKPFFNPLAKMIVSGTVTLEDEHWAKHRKIINSAFTSHNLKLMLPAMYLSCSEIIRKWEMLVPTEGSSEIDVWPYLGNLTGDVISRAAFSSSYEEGRRIFELLKELQKLTFKVLQSTYIPGWRFLPTKTNRKMKSIDKEVNAQLRDIIDRRKKAMKVGQVTNDDLLSVLLESNSNEMKENENKKGSGLTIEDVISECRLFYFAGQETTTVLLVWTMIMLGKHLNWQQLAREEVLQAFGNNKPDFDGLNHLKIVTMILNEVLRLYPPGTILVRITHQMIKLKDITLPPGVQLELPVILIHHDEEIWGKDAKEFKPERFSEGVAKATKSQTSFFPFSSGPRVCTGQNFAMLETKLAMAMILQRFSFELSPSYKHAPFPILTLQPQHGAKMILRKS